MQDPFGINRLFWVRNAAFFLGSREQPVEETMKLSLPRILILDAHSNPALACVRSLGRAGYEVLVASPVRLPLAWWSRHCRGGFRYDGPTLAAFRQVREWARDHGVSIVLPVSEESCALLNMERDAWEAAGITLGCAPADILANAFDKALTVKAAQKCGLRTPATEYPISLEQAVAAGRRLGYPCVVKPRFSQSWDGTRFVPSQVRSVTDDDGLRAAVTAARAHGSWPLIQEYVPGHGAGVFTLYDRGRPVAWFAQESIRSVRPMASPNCLRRSVPVNPQLRDQAERLLTSFGWHGPAMVELRTDSTGDSWLMEVNGRFWVSLQLAVSAGVDFPRLWVEALRGLPVTGPAAYGNVVLRWIWGDLKRFLGVMLSGPPAGYAGPYPSRREAVRDLLGPQPDGTILEMWQPDDQWPAVGEWTQALSQALGFLERRLPGTRTKASAPLTHDLKA
jgi:predicted ATP-grasp superfamily ATP-dependent carboligase